MWWFWRWDSKFLHTDVFFPFWKTQPLRNIILEKLKKSICHWKALILFRVGFKATVCLMHHCYNSESKGVNYIFVTRGPTVLRHRWLISYFQHWWTPAIWAATIATSDHKIFFLVFCIQNHFFHSERSLHSDMKVFKNSSIELLKER